MISKTLLSTLALLPLASTSANVATIANTTNTIKLNTNNEQEEKETEACTFMYVGKNVSTSGKAIVARSGDSSPRTMHHYFKEFKHNELANKVVKGKNGFEWTMPSTTYKYISTPRNPNFQRGLNWEVSGANENGVGVSATLTCYPSTQGLKADPYVKTGISEDNIAQIVAATATSARNGIETIANICKTIGSAESNAIMITDKDESWYMEMYTGHQYIAIKMPDDKACTIGNEFMLNTVAELKETFKVKDTDIIVSDDLFKLAKEGKGEQAAFAIYDETGKTDDDHIHLYKTYASDGSDTDKGQGKFTDGCHMRTWIGQYRFADTYQPYSEDGTTCAQIKYTPFFAPKSSYQEGKLSEADVISFMRDRFESVLAGPDGDYDTQYFRNQKDKLRVVGIENAYQIHVISVDPSLPKEISTTQLICMSNSNYSPFIPFNNGITSFTDEYSKVLTDFTYDDNTASQIYKRLNSLAALDRQEYGMPIVPYIQEHEQAWTAQYYHLLGQTKDKTLDEAINALTNYCKSLQVQGMNMSKTLFNDLLFHIENTVVGTTPAHKTFRPLVSLEYYANLYGWTYKRDGKTATLTNGNDTLTFDLDYKWDANWGKYFGQFKVNDGEWNRLQMHITDNVPFVQYDTYKDTLDGKEYTFTGVKEYIAKDHSVVMPNINDYIIKESKSINPLAWIIPCVVGIPLITGAIAVPIILSKRKKTQIPTTKK